MPESFSNVKELFEHRSLYDAVIQADYMSHDELIVQLAAWAKLQTVPLRIVDLGCSDAWLATHAFRDADVASYLGVELAESSVEQARTNTAIWPGRAKVVAGNLADTLHEQTDSSANVILASYSIHHFSTDAKLALIDDCRRVLVPGGTFFWIDAVRNDDESRDQYIKRLTDVMQRDWTVLTVDERDSVCTHVLTSDFPETGRWMLDAVNRAGFKQSATLLQSDFFDGWAFTRS